jgi:hypothetical protein
MLRELDFVESDWAAFAWAIGSTVALHRYSAPQQIRRQLEKFGRGKESILKTISQKAAGLLTGVLVAGAFLAICVIGLVRLHPSLFARPVLGAGDVNRMADPSCDSRNGFCYWSNQSVAKKEIDSRRSSLGRNDPHQPRDYSRHDSHMKRTKAAAEGGRSRGISYENNLGSVSYHAVDLCNFAWAILTSAPKTERRVS